MRVAERVKKINTNIKTIHYVAPQVWIWRKNRVKKIKKFIDHILLLFDFEKKYFDEENIKNTFVGHPLIENNEDNKKIIENIIPKDKKIISIFPGSRKSETDVLLNILIDFIKLMNKRHNDFYFYFHATDENKNLILSEIKKDTALNYLSEFILFWKDNGAALKTWNVKFVDFVKRKEIGSYNSKNEPGKFTKTFKERKSDQSWAEEIE